MFAKATEPPVVDSQRRRLSILVVSSDTFPPRRVDVSVLFGEELARRGHRIDWLLQSEQACKSAYQCEWGGGTVWVAATDLGPSLLSRVRKHTLGIIHDLKLFPLLRNGGYDIVEVKDKFISGLFAWLASRIYRRKFIFWLSYPFPESYLLRARDGTARYPLLYVIRGAVSKVLLYKLLLRAADHIFVQSEQMRLDVAEEGIPLDKTTAIPMGIKAGNFAENYASAQPRRVPPTGASLVYIGTLTRVRRMDFLVRVLKLVMEAIPNVTLHLVGGGDEPGDEQLIIDEARRLGISDAVVLAGTLPQAEALRYVSEAEVCLSPFYPTPLLKSASPTKLVEYMAMGKAVVANDHPEQRLVIERSGGGYCVPYDEAAFAAAILKLLREPETAALMGKRGRQYVLEHRSYDKIADIVEARLLDLAVDSAPAGG
jgi:glycosyltransferase involved in cell wall biosynthesis